MNWNPVRILICLALVAGLSNCGLGETKFQSIWKLEIGRAASAIDQYLFLNGVLPRTIDEVYGKYFPSDTDRIVAVRERGISAVPSLGPPRRHRVIRNTRTTAFADSRSSHCWRHLGPVRYVEWTTSS